MRIAKTTISLGFAGVLSLMGAVAGAQTSAQGTRIAQASQPAIDEPLTRTVRKPPRRVRIYAPSHYEPDIYPRYFPGSNAVRVCNATYVQEFRPSGTVIVPRMTCVWRGG